MVSQLIKETKARQLEAFKHRISVLCPGYDASHVRSPAEAMVGGGLTRTVHPQS